MLERFFTDHGWHGLHGFWFISNQQPDGSRQIRFVVDLPANQLGPGWRECNTVGGLPPLATGTDALPVANTVYGGVSCNLCG
jgi:hypothetical protein